MLQGLADFLRVTEKQVVDCAYVRRCFSRVQLFVTPWTVPLPGASVHEILQA